MITTGEVEIDAPASIVWDVFTDVERWPTWTASVTRLTALDPGPGPVLAVGSRFRIEQPRMPKLVWTVTSVTPGSAWTWEQRSPGGRTTAGHEVVDLGDGRTRVTQVLSQGGPIGALVGVLMKGLTRSYLDLEAAGLKQASEARAGRAAAS
jgi:uncharacterized membrane protein